MAVWILGIVLLLGTLANAEESKLCDHIKPKMNGGWNDIIIGVVDERPWKDLTVRLEEIMICKPDPDHVNFTRAFKNRPPYTTIYNINDFGWRKVTDYDPKIDSYFSIMGDTIYQTLDDGREFSLIRGNIMRNDVFPGYDVSSLALDPTGDRLYFVAERVLGYVKLDKPWTIRMVKNFTDSYPKRYLKSSIHVDNENDYLFVRFDDRVFRSKLDGSENRTILYLGDENHERKRPKLRQLHLDRFSDKLYYSTMYGDIYSTNLDGGDMELVEIEGNNDSKTLLMVDEKYIYYSTEWPILALRADKRTLVQDSDFELRDDRNGEESKFKMLFMLKDGSQTPPPTVLHL